MKKYILIINAKIVSEAQKFPTIEKRFNNLCNRYNKNEHVIRVFNTVTSDIVLTNDKE